MPRLYIDRPFFVDLVRNSSCVRRGRASEDQVRGETFFDVSVRLSLSPILCAPLQFGAERRRLVFYLADDSPRCHRSARSRRGRSHVAARAAYSMRTYTPRMIHSSYVIDLHARCCADRIVRGRVLIQHITLTFITEYQ